MRKTQVAGGDRPRVSFRIARLTSEQGFSIFDLLTAIAIVAILATMALPSMTQEMAKYRLNGAARQLVGELMAARMKAVAQSRDVKISFPDDHNFEICNDPCEDGGKFINIRDSYKDISISSNNNVIFTGKGLATSFGTITISNGQDVRNIKVTITGRVKVE